MYTTIFRHPLLDGGFVKYVNFLNLKANRLQHNKLFSSLDRINCDLLLLTPERTIVS